MRVVIALSVLAMLGAACASEPERGVADPPQRASVHAGADLAQRQCAACHAVGAYGASPMEEAPPFRGLGERYPPGALAEAFAEGIMVGHPAMPEFELTPEQIEDLIAYMEWLQAGGSVPARPAT